MFQEFLIILGRELRTVLIKNRNKEFIKNDEYLDMNNSFEYKLMPQSDDFENEERIENIGDILSRSI